MRVGIIAPPWVPVPPPAYGGTEAVIDVLARGLNAVGHAVTLFASKDSTCAVEREGIVDGAPGIDVGGSAVEALHVASAYERFSGFDVVHDHTILGPWYAADHGCGPVVTTNHNPFSGRFAAALRALEGRIPIIAISDHHASTSGDIPIAAVIRHGIEPQEFPFGTGDGGYALFLGRMSEEKGAHRAVRIAAEAGIPLLLAGKMRTDAERAYVDERVAPILSRGSEYLGEVDHHTKLGLLEHATCLLNPILWPEPFGMVMIEAMACGTPVLALANGAAPEIIDNGRTGFLAEDEEGLVAAIGHVDEIDRQACRAAVEGPFSARRMVEEHVALYEHLAQAWARTRAARR